LHVQAAVYSASPDPAEAFFLSVLIEMGKKIDRLEEKLALLESERIKRPGIAN